jgi:hypothetical protein
MGELGRVDLEEQRRVAAAKARDAEKTLVRSVHVWVLTRGASHVSQDWVPGVLAEWKQDTRGWFGLVAYSAPWWDPKVQRWVPRLSRDWVISDRIKVEGVGLTGLPPDRVDGTGNGWTRNEHLAVRED